MIDCGCEKAKADLEEYLHNELSSEDAGEVRDHIARCEDCSTEANIGIVLTHVMQRACKESAPEDLRNQVLQKLREIQSTH